MSTPRPDIEKIVDSFGLTPRQKTAALARGQDVVVTAGAGSGKTRTLVARYVSLLAEGISPRRLVAITFTEKAAREMRSRVRSALNSLIAQAVTPAERQVWTELDAGMDAARIGTIHSLCAEILRAHPAEAGIDPRFSVIEEGLGAAIQARAVADTLAWIVGQASFAPLLAGFKTGGLQKLLAFLLKNRLEAQAAFAHPAELNAPLIQALQSSLDLPAIQTAVEGLRRLASTDNLRDDAGDKLADQVEGLLDLWARLDEALSGGDWFQSACLLFAARREKLGGGAGKKTSLAKTWVAELKQTYDEQLDPWLGGKNAGDIPPDADAEALFTLTSPLMTTVFDHLLQSYRGVLQQLQAVDFDDLEWGAVQLLARPEISRLWQHEVDALLVDEFQDTNARQRELILALRGDTPGRLFVVGDARQSIYRFRRADVTVFRSLQEEIRRAGGLVIDLDLTFRAHAPLLEASGDLLSAIMGTQPDPQRPFFVPFSPLLADHEQPRTGMTAPHVEFVLGAGENAESARPPAARALARRLAELHESGQIQRWDDVALLFRASTGFPDYEEAFEEAGVPFVTIAGQGFFDRPEIRDVLNLLRAFADPWDDLAMAGLLRSPAFGLSDAALYQLRWQGETLQPYWTALNGDVSALSSTDADYARRALGILNELLPLVDRLPVAELLKRIIDRVDYRAILASIASQGPAGRLWRNLDKLLADAQASELVNVRTFLEYLDTLRDVGAREGEAPAEALGAVRLLTIHKSKGLEFPLVVLADAARSRRNSADQAYWLANAGLAYKFDQLEASPLFYRLAAFRDQEQSLAEEKRLLYVAVTRAQEKLLVSGHCTPARDGFRAGGSLGELLAAGGIDPGEVIDQGESALICPLPCGQTARAWALGAGASEPRPADDSAPAAWPESREVPLYRTLLVEEADFVDEEQIELAIRPKRVTGGDLQPPPAALGNLVHYAIQHWLFPGHAKFFQMLEIAAISGGIADPRQRADTIHLAAALLTRLQQHAILAEMDAADQRYHEVPYSHFLERRRLDTGYIDVLYHTPEGWQILDFKTDALRDATRRQEIIAHYRPQMRRYLLAVRGLLNETARIRLCFLDDQGKISLEEM